MTTVVVKWKGPYSKADLRNLEDGNGIYLIAGKLRNQQIDSIQYCGITRTLFRTRICSNAHPCWQIRSDTLSIWLGEVVYPDKFSRPFLEVAEHCFISFWQPDLNRDKKIYCPRKAICLISEWFKIDGSPRRNRPEIIRDLPDVLWWDEERWRTGKLRVGPIVP